MFERTDNNEITSRNEDEKKIGAYLRDIQKGHVDKFGLNWNVHSLVCMQRQTLSRVLYYNNIYQQIVGVPGVICEFGVQWGATLAQLISLRGIYEPFNHRRHIYGFDSFEGFVNTSKEKDGTHLSDGDFEVYSGYEKELENILKAHEALSPIPHKQKFSLIKGDASKTVPKWIESNKHAIIALAIFDMDIYQPTRDALEAILPRLTKGSVLVFDELNCSEFPGETEAVDEVLKINNLRLRHYPHQPSCAWTVWGE